MRIKLPSGLVPDEEGNIIVPAHLEEEVLISGGANRLDKKIKGDKNRHRGQYGIFLVNKVEPSDKKLLPILATSNVNAMRRFLGDDQFEELRITYDVVHPYDMRKLNG